MGRNQFGSEPALEQMAGDIILAIKVYGVHHAELLHHLTDGNIARFQLKMDMICHQAVGQNRTSVVVLGLEQTIAINSSILFIPKNILAMIAAADDVIHS